MVKLYCSKVSHNPYKEIMITEITENIFLVNGYDFGDRLLEDVMFEVNFLDKKILSIKVEDESKSYFEDLNTKKWLAEAKKYAQRILDQGGDEVEIPKKLKTKYFKKGINVAYIAQK